MTAAVQLTEPVLHPATRLGAVRLAVTNLARSVAFYQQVLGFQLHAQSGAEASLGAGCADLLQLVEVSGASAARHTKGFCHFAILMPSRLALGQVLRNLVAHGVQLGGADHVVNEAVYLADPDGIGIELSWDRPCEQWQYVDGHPVLDNLPLDYRGILCGLVGEPTCWQGLEPTTVIGHLHLHSDELAAAINFYHKLVGFDLRVYQKRVALFSAGNNHHLIGIDSGEQPGATPTMTASIGLRHFVLELPNATAHSQLAERLVQGGVAITEEAAGLLVRDPAQNALLLTVAQAT
ncbi:MAG: VOC family protein [Caldilineaceae bacterium]|nr:VOC family protein [Caldilineaceae bacterium]